jgi:hypothetical protein
MASIEKTGNPHDKCACFLCGARHSTNPSAAEKVCKAHKPATAYRYEVSASWRMVGSAVSAYNSLIRSFARYFAIPTGEFAELEDGSIAVLYEFPSWFHRFTIDTRHYSNPQDDGHWLHGIARFLKAKRYYYENEKRGEEWTGWVRTATRYLHDLTSVK